MVRKQVYIEVQQEDLLKKISKESKIPESEIIRQGINQRIATAPDFSFDPEAWEEEKAFITRFLKRGRIKGKKHWKREDLYER